MLLLSWNCMLMFYMKSIVSLSNFETLLFRVELNSVQKLNSFS